MDNICHQTSSRKKKFNPTFIFQGNFVFPAGEIQKAVIF